MVRDQLIPVKWLSNAHVQTMWPFFFRKTPTLVRQRERFTTPDNDFFDVDWCGTGEKGIVVLIHGLTGSSTSHYILGMQKTLIEHGYTTAAINCRACSGEPNMRAGSYHAGFTNDLDQLYRTIRDRHVMLPIFIVGFSLGGNIMLKWLGEKANSLDINGATAVSVPYKLAHCANKVDTGLSKIYRHHLIYEMKKKLANKLEFFRANNLLDEAQKLEKLGNISSIKSFWEFDNDVVARLHGFDDVHDYYKKSSSIHYLKAIQTPTLLIHAEDDPFTSKSVLPNSGELSESTRLLTTMAGGHVGFIGATEPKGNPFWLEKIIPDYINRNNV